jgi:polysaccharide pyruvyl transferase WcaK-like protein
MIIEIKGVQFANKGAELMLRVIIERLTTLAPGTEFAITPNPNSSFEQIIKAGASLRLRVGASLGAFDQLTYRLPVRIRRLLRRYGTVVESDLDAVIDASGYAYGAVWGEHSMLQTAREVTRFAMLGKPYVFMPQAFGPFEPGRITTQFGHALRQARLICARDPDSHSAIETLLGGHSPQLHLFPDFTTTAAGRPAHAEHWQIDRRTVLLVPNVEMIGSRNPDQPSRERYRGILQEACAEAARLGFRVRLLNHGGSSDAQLCEELRTTCNLASVINERDPLVLRSLLGAAGLVISSRFHACIAALSQGVPCVGTSWSHKYQHMFNDYGAQSSLLMSMDSERMRAAIRETIADRDRISLDLLKRQKNLAERTDRMWELVLSAVQSRGSTR